MNIKRAFIPNMITMGNMVFGFFAIIFASKGTPESLAFAGILVFAASICDMLDGATARALGVETAIGVQLDSLADAVSYGIAPGIIAYQAYLKNLPELVPGIDLGMIIAPLFPVFAIYRLARFNLGEEQSGFSGLPSPPAGIIVSAVPALEVAKSPFLGSLSYSMPLLMYIVLFVGIGLLMVSTVDYKKLFSELYKKGPAVRIITFVVIFLLLFLFRMWAVFLVTAIYILFGLIKYFYKFRSFNESANA